MNSTIVPASDGVHLNSKGDLYVIPSGNGFSCLGTDVVMKRAAKLVDWLNSLGYGVMGIEEHERGTMYAYKIYAALAVVAKLHCGRENVRCPIELTPELIGLEGKRVEVVDCYGETRRFWVGKSTGWMPCHLEVLRSNSSGGMAVMGTPFKSVKLVTTRTTRCNRIW